MKIKDLTIKEVDGIWVDKEHFTYVDKREIVKHSPNLEEINQYKDGKSIIALIGIIDEKDIQTIVTKEQIKAIEYRVKE